MTYTYFSHLTALITPSPVDCEQNLLQTYMRFNLQHYINVSILFPTSDNDGDHHDHRHKCLLFSSYLPQLLVFLQSHHLGRVGDLDFVVFTGGDSGLGGLDRALQVGPPYAVHAPETKNNMMCEIKEMTVSKSVDFNMPCRREGGRPCIQEYGQFECWNVECEYVLNQN